MIDGKIEEGRLPAESTDFVNAMGALYGISYTLKFALRQRKEAPIDYPVMPSEGLWWVEDGKIRYPQCFQLEMDADDHAARFHR